MGKGSEIREDGRSRGMGTAAGWLMSIWTAGLRYEIVDRCGIGRRDGEGGPVIYMLWHNRIFVVPEAWRRLCGGRRRAVVLTSASRDGTVLARAVGVFGIGAVRGSSSRRAVAALVALRRALREGIDCCVTPDGPRGPRYRLQGGVLKLAEGGVPVIPVHVEFEDAWELPSWDGFRVPKPFSKVRVVFDEALAVPGGLGEDEFEAWRARLEDVLKAGVAELSEER